MRARWFVALASLVFSISTVAQVPDPYVAAQAPQPGSGHHYVGMGGENVNLADGSLSFDLPISTPAGRGLSFPFGIRYSTPEEFYIKNNPGGYTGYLRWDKWNLPLQSYGWSYAIPAITARTQVAAAAPDPYGHIVQCLGTGNYVFRGLDGLQRTLAIGNLYLDPANQGLLLGNPDLEPASQDQLPANPDLNPAGQDQLPGFCPRQIISNSNSHGVLATTPTIWEPPSQPPVTVVDASGTTYQFGQGPSEIGLGGSSPQSWGMYVSTITDRNGNQITLNPDGKSYNDTLGRTVVSWSGLGNNNDTITVTGLGGNIVLHWATITRSLQVGGQNMGPQTCTSGGSVQWNIKTLTDIVLPNGRTYSFQYDPTYGRISKITFPSGGYVRYVWGANARSAVTSQQWWVSTLSYSCAFRYDTPAVTHRYVSYDGVNEVLHQAFSYETVWGSANWNTKKTTVTSTDLVTGQSTTTVYNYRWVAPDPAVMQDPNAMGNQVPVESSVVYRNATGTVFRTVQKTWKNSAAILGEQTILENGKGATRQRCYDSNEQVVTLYEYDFLEGVGNHSDPQCYTIDFQSGSGAHGDPGLTNSAIGPLQRRTVTVYEPFSAPTHIVNAPQTVTLYDGSGTAPENEAQRTSFTYTDSVWPSATATGWVPVTTSRGNIGLVSHKVSAGSSLVTNYTWYDNGQLQSATDPGPHTTSYYYTDNFAGGTGTPPGQTNAYLTHVSFPDTGVAHNEYFSWGYSDGQLRSHTDQNSQITSYQYNDTLARLTELDAPSPDGGVTQFLYTDTPGAVKLQTRVQMDGTNWRDSYVLYDGLMHPIAQSSANGQGSWDRVDTCYNGFGKVRFKSYPYLVASPTAAPNCASGVGDTYAYDVLGRGTQVTHSDGTSILTAYNGRATQVQDEGNGTRRVGRVSQIDGLGRMISVCEQSTQTLPVGDPAYKTPTACGQDVAQTGFLTTYAYNTVGDLLTVTQPGLLQRTFTYDMLSRLLTAYNPESGTTTYAYDVDSSCPAQSFPGLLISRVDARGIRTCMAYDELDRLIQKTHLDGTPGATFSYDQTSAYGVNLLNTIGRLSSESTAGTYPTGKVFSYDQIGRVKINSQCTPQSCPALFSITYTYNQAGDMLSSTNGEGVTLSYTPNLAGRLTTVMSSLSDPQHPPTLFSSGVYNPAGSLLSATLGNGVGEARTYDSRLRLASITAGAVYALTIPGTGGYAPNGDILLANDSINGNWVYTYDDFNRVSTAVASNKGWGCSWDYDRYGNRWHQNTYNGSCVTPTLSFSGSTNRIDGYSYDQAGNLLYDGTHNYVYDAESRVIQVDGTPGDCGTASACYVYNAEGQRVRRALSSASYDYLYDLAGHAVTEIRVSDGVWNRGEVYAGGRHIATYANSTTYFTHSDWLGTERVRTTAAGTALETCTSLPFGDNQVCQGGDVSPLHFTGKERDSETGLDYFGARYNASNTGRFMSPDPLGGKLINPQTLNKYTYATDNPINLTDPTGLYVCADDAQNAKEHCTSDNDKAFEAQRQEALKSKDAAVVRGASAFGDPGKDNGVTVAFGDPGEGDNGITTHDIETDLSKANGMRAKETVTIRDTLTGTDLQNAVSHEGSHVADAQAFVNSITPTTADYALNLTKYQTELGAYMVTQSVLSRANEKRTYDCGVTGSCQLGAGVRDATGNINRLLDYKYHITRQNQGSRLYPAFVPPPPAVTVPH